MKTLLPFLLIAFLLSSCSKNGCNNPDATNYNKKAKENDGSCIYPELRNEMVGEYAVEINRIIYLGQDIGDTIYFDTITISKSGAYNTLRIDSDYYTINFQTNQLKYLTNEHHSAPTGIGHLQNNQMTATLSYYTLHGALVSYVCKSGHKIN